MSTEHGEEHKDDRTKNSDVSSADPDLNPSAMTSNDDDNVTEETPREELYEQHNTVYSNSKTNSPNHRNHVTPPSSSLPISESSNQIKDDPYNFSEEEDVFSPQLPSRQFSSSNATHQQGEIGGTDSNDPAMERLKAEHR